MLGLSESAWVIILTALATYIGLFSAWLLALPARRAALLQGNITAIEASLSGDRMVREDQEAAIANMKMRAAMAVGTDRRLIARGLFMLALSMLVYGTALVVQIRTDAAFRPSGSPAAAGAASR